MIACSVWWLFTFVIQWLSAWKGRSPCRPVELPRHAAADFSIVAPMAGSHDAAPAYVAALKALAEAGAEILICVAGEEDGAVPAVRALWPDAPVLVGSDTTFNPKMNNVRKGLEAGFTVLIETLWGKRRIMEVYLNVVEWGPGLYGAEAAARAYFHKAALELGPEEAALLAGACVANLSTPAFALPYGAAAIASCCGTLVRYAARSTVPSTTPPFAPVAVRGLPAPVIVLPRSLNQPAYALSFSSARNALHAATCPAFAHGAAIARKLKDRIRAEERLTASVGVALARPEREVLALVAGATPKPPGGRDARAPRAPKPTGSR